METDSSKFLQTLNRLVLHSSPGKLQEIACVTISAYLLSCKRYEFQNFSTRGFQGHPSYEYIYFENITQLPSIIRHMIDKCARKMWRNLYFWWVYHARSIAELPTNEDSSLEWINLISWCAEANGTINYQQSARNLLESEALCDEEKYRIACAYCFVENILRLASSKHEHWNPLVKYWNYRMEGKGNMLSEATLLWDANNELSLNRSALEYLWEYLTDDEQNNIIIERNETSIWNFFDYVACSLNETQLEYLIESHVVQLFIQFNNKVEFEHLAVIFWNHIKNTISVNSFYKILKESDYEIASEIWTSASDILKTGVLARYMDELTRIMCDDWFDYPNGTFMMDLLSAYPPGKREAVWRTHWTRITAGLPVKNMQMMMKLCLGSDVKVASFKKIHMCNYSEAKNYVKKMLARKYFKELSEFLRFITDDPEVIIDFRINILKSEHFLRHYVDSLQYFNKVDWYDQLVNETFPDPNQLNEFKKYLITNKESMEYFRSSMEKGKLFVGIPRFCDHVLSSMPNVLVLTQVKSKLLKIIRDVLISAQFECSWCTHIALDKFLKWCLNGENDLLMKFKDNLPVDKIFIKLIKRLRYQLDQLRTQTYGKDELEDLIRFEELDFFLFWFFKDYDKIRDFKLAKLRARRHIKEVRSLFKLKYNVLNNLVMNWFKS